jgi:hypothetical protein
VPSKLAQVDSWNNKRQYCLTPLDEQLLDRLAAKHLSNRAGAFRLAIRAQRARDAGGTPTAALGRLYARVAPTVALAGKDAPAAAKRAIFRMDPKDIAALDAIARTHGFSYGDDRNKAAAARFAIRVQAALEGVASARAAG